MGRRAVSLAVEIAIAIAIALAAPITLALAEAPNMRTTAPTLTKHPQLDRNSVIILVRGVMATLDNANRTGNYTVMRDLAAPAFAAANDPSRLAEIFANLRRNNLDLSGTLVVDPQLLQLPDFDQNGNLHISGFFPSVPMQVNFQLIFAPVNGQWRLLGITTNVAGSGPVAPDPPQFGAANGR